ncbi:MAG: trypsin-like peptidase domain-containing protein [Acidobacteriaceae bacterium]
MASIAAKSLDVVPRCRFQRQIPGTRYSVRRMVSCLLFSAVMTCPKLAVSGNLVPQASDSGRNGTPSKEMSAETIFKRFASRILVLSCVESADESKLASGVLVSPDGFVLTNAHVVEGCRSMTAIHIYGDSRQSYVPVLKYCDELKDVAVLKITGNGFDSFAVPVHSPQTGERVFAIGNPRGLEQSISEGIVSANRVIDGTPWIQHSAPISPGSSGGALISDRGELVGINSWMLTESENLNFAVPSVTLAAALSRARARAGTLDFPQNGDEQFSIGMLYVRGQGVPQDYAEAAKWIQQAADKGHAEAQATLGGLFELGKGEPQDYAQAALWYRKAAEHGLPFAQWALGELLSNGNGVQRDATEAVKWFRLAAEQGDANAEFELGAAYQFGTGAPMDYSESYLWYKIASIRGVNNLTTEEVSAVLKAAASHLSPDAKFSADERARKWLVNHPPDSE